MCICTESRDFLLLPEPRLAFLSLLPTYLSASRKNTKRKISRKFSISVELTKKSRPFAENLIRKGRKIEEVL
jgi:hypothetical protein